MNPSRRHLLAHVSGGGVDHIVFAILRAFATRGGMDFDDLMFRYFGTAALDEVSDPARAAGVERMLVDFGLSRDRNGRFALWALLHMLGAAPDLDVAFPEPADREAARNFMDLVASSGEGT